ncbi:MAG: peptidoglycan D,D-transpeptidase FtsI family protein [Lachnospiraceae bacterium]
MAKKLRFVRYMQHKLMFVLGLLALAYAFVCFQLVKINVKDGKTYEKQVLSQQRYDSTVLPFQRGEIKDRKGTVLAASVKVYNFILEPKNVIEADQYKDEARKGETKRATIDAIVHCFGDLGITSEELDEIITNNPDSYYEKIGKLRKLTYEQRKEFEDYLKTEIVKTNDEGKQYKTTIGASVAGYVFEEEYKRSYPNGTSACHILGYTSSGNVGNWGIEQAYNSYLNGTNGREYGYLTEGQEVERTVKPAVNGNSIISTIDLNIQGIAEKHIKKFMKEVGASNVSCLIMDPNNGEVLTMANSNTYDPNNPQDEKPLNKWYSKKELKRMGNEKKLEAYNKVWKNFIVTNTYEPGSTFKPFTVAAGLEEHILKGNETYFCDGYQQYAGYRIRCNNVDGHGSITLSQAIELSCNDALMQINANLGAEVFSKYQKIFGFGNRTGIDLPGEEDTSSLIYGKEELSPINLATNSFGQSFNCSMLQLGSAFCSLINGGNYYKPHIVKQIVDENGSVVKNYDKVLVRKTVSEETSKVLRSYLYRTVQGGTGKSAYIEGYSIGGKTGTAEKVPRNNGKYLVSFVGFAPVENPQFLIYVTIDELNQDPQSQSRFAVELTRDIMEELVVYMNVPQETKKTSKLINSWADQKLAQAEREAKE